MGWFVGDGWGFLGIYGETGGLGFRNWRGALDQAVRIKIQTQFIEKTQGFLNISHVHPLIWTVNRSRHQPRTPGN